MEIVNYVVVIYISMAFVSLFRITRRNVRNFLQHIQNVVFWKES